MNIEGSVAETDAAMADDRSAGQRRLLLTVEEVPTRKGGAASGCMSNCGPVGEYTGHPY
ncbi:hypothetical protein [Streptomyces sp. NPDC050388]|uniref:hypothetical protein n=1 Tax=Streptomyces sp. NPDC050388 TaxID=3155781 RepID=UPI0034424113